MCAARLALPRALGPTRGHDPVAHLVTARDQPAHGGVRVMRVAVGESARPRCAPLPLLCSTVATARSLGGDSSTCGAGPHLRSDAGAARAQRAHLPGGTASRARAPAGRRPSTSPARGPTMCRAKGHEVNGNVPVFFIKKSDCLCLIRSTLCSQQLDCRDPTSSRYTTTRTPLGPKHLLQRDRPVAHSQYLKSCPKRSSCYRSPSSSVKLSWDCTPS